LKSLGGCLSQKFATANSIIYGENTQLNIGIYSCSTLGENFTFNAGLAHTINALMLVEYTAMSKKARIEETKATENSRFISNSISTLANETIRLNEKTRDIINEKVAVINEKTGAIDHGIELINNRFNTCATTVALEQSVTTTREEYTAAIATATIALATRQQMTDVNRKIGNMEEEIATTIITMAEKHDALVTETVALEETRTHLTLNFDIA